ncbi:hypothetical protein ACFFTN_07895 [Aminobacter aganoensis]|uniref:Uncharacterized protein n=1 Tax=Aminobacter aganoensis TaxID=83264 RepID=A0A7X0KM19_9HYPH|nr:MULTISPECIES: hypothetical protein [Aminobacter]KQU73158.1 hypothetical protein ASC75_05775 [Aminobacter sp. DSM 101952]MBB6355618.1 hypothetical protein [Aminobacter aganoensis]
MQGDAIQLRQPADGSPKAAFRRSYLANVFRRALALFPSTRSHPQEHADGLEAFDMLGGWQGSDRKQRKR